MKISVIIPFFNEAHTLKQTLLSLARQTLRPNEIILVDSGSTDDSVSIINEFVKDNRIDYIHIIHSGRMTPSSSINLGIKKAEGELIAYVDCDLDIPKTWLESNLDQMIKSNSDLVSPRVYTSGTKIIDKSFIAHTYGYKSYTPCLTGSLIKRVVIEKVDFFLSDARANYDVDFINKIREFGFKRVINKKITLRYFGTEYCDSFLSGMYKIAFYSQNAWRVRGDKKPYLYLGFAFFLLLSFYIGISSVIVAIYLITRGFLIPFYKSSFNISRDIWLILLLPFTGLLIDISRISGYLFLHKILIRGET